MVACEVSGEETVECVEAVDIALDPGVDGGCERSFFMEGVELEEFVA